MGHDRGEQALSVLRGIWTARQQTAEDLGEGFGNARICRNTASLGLHDVDDDMRALWRAKLESEGKLSPDGTSVRDLVLRATGTSEEPRHQKSAE